MRILYFYCISSYIIGTVVSLSPAQTFLHAVLCASKGVAQRAAVATKRVDTILAPISKNQKEPECAVDGSNLFVPVVAW